MRMEGLSEDVACIVCGHLLGAQLAAVRATAWRWHHIADAVMCAREMDPLCDYLRAMGINSPAVPHRWLLRYALRRGAPASAPTLRYVCSRCDRRVGDVAECDCMSYALDAAGASHSVGEALKRAGQNQMNPP